LLRQQINAGGELEDMATANMEINSASDVTSRSEMLASQERTGRKDEIGSSSDNQLTMSIFFSLLQNRLAVQNGTEKTSDRSLPAETSLKGFFNKEANAEGVSQKAMIESSRSLEGQGNANSLITQISELLGDKKSAGQDLDDFLKANGLTLQTLGKLLASGGDGSKGEAFLKNIASWLKTSGVQENRIEQIMSQIKSIALSAKDELSQGAYQKEMADFLKGQHIHDKEVQNMQGGTKGIGSMFNGHPGTADKGDDLSTGFSLTGSDKKADFTAAGTDKQNNAANSPHDLMSAVKMTNDEGGFSMNNGLMTDQKQMSFSAGANEGTGRSALMSNLKPQELIEQIVQNRQIFERGQGRVRITLNPPSLGTIDMDVRVRNNKVEVMMMADNRDVKQLLQTNLDELKTALRDQGLSVERFNIQWQNQNSGQGSFSFANDGSQWQDGRSGSRQGRQAGEGNNLTAEEYPLRAVTSAGGNTGLISVFI
jgi:hypothetical protein